MLLRLDASHSYSIHLLVFIFSTSVPFQSLCQGVEDEAVCVLALIESLVSVEAKSYVWDIFR